MEYSDEDLMLEVKNGTLDAMIPLFERYNVRLYNFFLRLTSNRETSEDLTQNVFTRILKYRHTYKNEGSFRAWIYKTARNTHIDYLRQNKLKMASGEYQEGIKGANTDERDYLLKEKKEILYEAIGLLPEEERQIIELSRFQDLKYEEIADVLSCSVGNVRVKVHRAVNKLREVYFSIA